MEIWNLVFIQDRIDAGAPVRRAPPREERRHRLVAGARGGGAPGRGQRLRDGPAPAVAGGGGVPVGAHARPGQPRRRVPEDHRRTRPGHRVPDRGRGPAGERGTRLHPAADATPDGLARPSARDRARRDGSDHRRRGGRRSATRTRRSGTTRRSYDRWRGPRRSGSRARSGKGSSCSTTRRGEPVTDGSRETTPSSSRTRSGSPCSSRRSSRRKRACPSTSIGSRRCSRSSAIGRGAPPRRCRSASTQGRHLPRPSWATRPWSPTPRS